MVPYGTETPTEPVDMRSSVDIDGLGERLDRCMHGREEHSNEAVTPLYVPIPTQETSILPTSGVSGADRHQYSGGVSTAQPDRDLARYPVVDSRCVDFDRQAGVIDA